MILKEGTKFSIMKDFYFIHATGKKENLYFRVFTVQKLSNKMVYCSDSVGKIYILPRKVGKVAIKCR